MYKNKLPFPIILKWIICFSACSFLFSCEEPVVPDPIDPRLPSYMVSGNDVAGALINDSAWIAKTECVFFGCKEGISFSNYHYDDTNSNPLNIFMKGREMDDVNKNFLNFRIVINDININSGSDLYRLKGKSFSLAGNNFATLDDYSQECRSSNGQIFFREVRENDELTIFVSGTFGFVIEGEGCKTLRVLKGRFSKVVDKNFTQ